jgi:hypothetical protein
MGAEALHDIAQWRHPAAKIHQVTLEAEKRLEEDSCDEHHPVLQRVDVLAESFRAGCTVSTSHSDVVGDEAGSPFPGEHLAPDPLGKLVTQISKGAPQRLSSADPERGATR